jgi:hypothetical protein
MSTTSWYRGVLAAARAARAGGRIAALAGLVGAGLLLGPVMASAAERGAQQAAGPRKESPYARYAREHAKTAEKKPARVKPTSPLARGPRVSARGARH